MRWLVGVAGFLGLGGVGLGVVGFGVVGLGTLAWAGLGSLAGWP